MTERVVAEENLKEFRETAVGDMVPDILDEMYGPDFQGDSTLVPSVWKDKPNRCPLYAYHCFHLTPQYLKTLNFEDMFKQGSINDNLETCDSNAIDTYCNFVIPIGFHFETRRFASKTLESLDGFSVSNVTVSRIINSESELQKDMYKISIRIDDYTLNKDYYWINDHTRARQFGWYTVEVQFDGMKPPESRVEKITVLRETFWEDTEHRISRAVEPDTLIDLYFEVYSPNSQEHASWLCDPSYYNQMVDWIPPDEERKEPKLKVTQQHASREEREKDIEIIDRKPHKEYVELEPHATRHTFEPKVITFEEGQEEHIRSELIPKEIVEDEVWNGFLQTEKYEYDPDVKLIHKYDHTRKFNAKDLEMYEKKEYELPDTGDKFSPQTVRESFDWIVERGEKYESPVHALCIERLRKEKPPYFEPAEYLGARLNVFDYFRITTYQMKELIRLLNGKKIVLDKTTFNDPNMPQIINFQMEGNGMTEEGIRKPFVLTLKDIQTITVFPHLSDEWEWSITFIIKFNPESEWYNALRLVPFERFNRLSIFNGCNISIGPGGFSIFGYGTGYEEELYKLLELDVLQYFFIDFYTPRILSKELEDVSPEIMQRIERKSVQFTGPLGKPEPVWEYSREDIPTEMVHARDDELDYIELVTDRKKCKQAGIQYDRYAAQDLLREARSWEWKGKDAWYESWIPKEERENYLKWRVTEQENYVKWLEKRHKQIQEKADKYWWFTLPEGIAYARKENEKNRIEADKELEVRKRDLEEWQNSKLQKADA